MDTSMIESIKEKWGNAKNVFFDFESLNNMVILTIPIYTNKNLHPTKKRPDCPMEKDYKLGLRRLMLKELSEIKSTIQIDEIVKKYELKVNML